MEGAVVTGMLFSPEPGFYPDMPDREYFADPWGADNPSLSASLAKKLLDVSPQHAWVESPHYHHDLKPAFNTTPAMRFGKAVHSLVFGGDKIVVVKARDWRGKLARERKATAEANGMIPILEVDQDRLKLCAERVRLYFNDLMGEGYEREVVALWHGTNPDETPAGPRRCKTDTSSRDKTVIVDLKTTERLVNHSDLERRIFASNMHIQAASNVEAVETLKPELMGRVEFYIQFIEQQFPWGLADPILVDPVGVELGMGYWREAGRQWDEAIANGRDFTRFNGHPRKALPPDWMLTKAEWHLAAMRRRESEIMGEGEDYTDWNSELDGG